MPSPVNSPPSHFTPKMFDIGFSELLLIAVVALIVIGPERLPKVARTVGHLFGRLQRYVNDVKADIHREMELDELKKLQSSVQEAARGLENTLHSEVRQTENQVREAVEAGTAETSSDETFPDLAPLAEPPASAESPQPAPEINDAPSGEHRP